MKLPPYLIEACRGTSSSQTWLEELPANIVRLSDQWKLNLQAPYETDVSCSWVAPGTDSDHRPCVLKLGMPHMEARDEAAGLRLWNGHGAVRVYRHDSTSGAILLERCCPGESLRTLPECEQDIELSKTLRKLWTAPPESHGLRPLSNMIEHWTVCTLEDQERWPDEGLVNQGLSRFRELLRSSPQEVLLCTDLHAGNLLAAQREPWLMIDPKPFVGDPAYDITQHLLNCRQRLQRDPRDLVARVADLLELSSDRISAWLFARAAAEPRGDWNDSWTFELAKVLA